jgi:hypothetical protein
VIDRRVLARLVGILDAIPIWEPFRAPASLVIRVATSHANELTPERGVTQLAECLLPKSLRHSAGPKVRARQGGRRPA